MCQILFAFFAKTEKELVLAVKAKRFGNYSKGYDFEVRKLWNNHTPWHIDKFIYPISGKTLAYSEESYKIYDEVAHTQSNSS